MSDTREGLEADRLALRQARMQMLTGQSVKEVAREGRRLVFVTPTIDVLNTAIAEVEDRLAALDNPSARPRYHALSVSFR